jgi:hypothetical protein
MGRPLGVTPVICNVFPPTGVLVGTGADSVTIPRGPTVPEPTGVSEGSRNTFTGVPGASPPEEVLMNPPCGALTTPPPATGCVRPLGVPPLTLTVTTSGLDGPPLAPPPVVAVTVTEVPSSELP